MNNSLDNQQFHRVVTMLNREEIDFLDKLSKDAQFASGHRLSRTQILRALVEAMREAGFRMKGVDSEQTLVNRIKQIMEHKTGGVQVASERVD